MRKLLIITTALISLFASSCKKSEDISFDKLSPKDQASMALSNPTSTSPGMRNYESFFTSKADAKVHGYIISTPLDYDPNSSKQYPLLVFLHGQGEKPYNAEYDIDKLKIHGPHKEIFYSGRSFPAIIVSIQLNQYEGEFNPAVIKEFIDVLTGAGQPSWSSYGEVGYGKYNIDVNRIHLTGLSLGGNGVYKTAAAYPDMFASLSVFAGYTCPQDGMKKIHIPAYIRHNAYDYVVGSYNAYNAQSWINESSPSEAVNLIVFNSQYHESWTAEYGRTDADNVFNWHWSKSLKGSVSIPTSPAPAPSLPAYNNSSSSVSATSLFPSTNSNVAATNLGRLDITYSTNMVKSNGLIEIKNLTDNTSFTTYSGWGMVSVNNNTVSIYPVPFVNGKRYAVRMAKGAFKDYAGNESPAITDDYTWTFTAGTSTTEQVSSPATGQIAVNTFYPSNNSYVAAPSDRYLNLTLDFNKNVAKGSGLIKVTNETDNTTQTYYANWGMVGVNGSKVSIYPVPVQSGKKYTVTIAGDAFKDQSGVNYSGTSSWTFNVY